MTTEQEYLELAEDCKKRIEEKNRKIKSLESDLKHARDFAERVNKHAKNIVLDYLYMTQSAIDTLINLDPFEYDDYESQDIRDILETIRNNKLNEFREIFQDIPKILNRIKAVDAQVSPPNIEDMDILTEHTIRSMLAAGHYMAGNLEDDDDQTRNSDQEQEEPPS